jgi:Uma2 family endonuclease
MATPVTSSRPFQTGTGGWSAADLDDPDIARQWDEGRFEIVEGVLSSMPAAYLDSSRALKRLVRVVERHLDDAGIGGEVDLEVDFVAAGNRVPRVDAVYMTPEDDRRQQQANANRGRRELKYGRLLVPPTLIIECLSIGHEAHDRLTKRAWYAQAKAPNFWLLDPFARALDCLVLDGADYRLDQAGRGNDEVRPALFPGLIIQLAKVWAR